VRVESGAQTPSIGFRRRSPDLLHVKCRVILSLSNAAFYTRSRAKVNSHNQTLARLEMEVFNIRPALFTSARSVQNYVRRSAEFCLLSLRYAAR
jgi:hypothetical protein